MAVITFCSNEIKETGQTLSMAAIASYMACLLYTSPSPRD